MRRGRFAPTPSGQLHIGNAWTALLSWLQMRSVGGEFVLRMEDIDKPRSRPEYAAQILDDLRWLGLDWDEGPDVGGPYAPYVQSERESLYEEAISRLIRADRVHPCFCSRAELQSIASAPHGLTSEGTFFTDPCRHLSPAVCAEKATNKEPSMRFTVPERAIDFTDLAAGPQHFPAGFGGDYVVKRADGIMSYQLAVVVDDAAMQITDVLRGWDLLDSTPRQILLYEALGLPVPQFTHVPLLLAPDGQRLSKRNQSTTIKGIREVGTQPEQVIGWLGYLSGLLDRPKAVQASELKTHFDLAKVPRESVKVPQEMLQALVEVIS